MGPKEEVSTPVAGRNYSPGQWLAKNLDYAQNPSMSEIAL
jgi:hypothetical protein